jgi:predicted small lipoprotein YifL
VTLLAVDLLLNFKIIFLLIIVTSFYGCGVKGSPLKYPETIVESYTREYTGSDPTPEELERIKNTKVIPSVVDPKQSTIPVPPAKP